MRADRGCLTCLILFRYIFSLAVAVEGEVGSMCVRPEPVICDDDENNCNRDVSFSCYNGECKDDGICECNPCWTGVSCNTSANLHAPTATLGSTVEVSIPEDHPIFEVFLNIDTLDLDDDPRCLYQTCPCVLTHFTIRESSARDIFGVETIGKKGAFFLKKEGGLKTGENIDLSVIVSNVDESRYSEMTVKIFVLPPLRYDDYVEVAPVRHRRAVEEVLDVNDTLHFSMEVIHPSPSNISNITVGTHVDILVTLVIPPGISIPSLNLEFFAETDNATTFAVVCEPGVRDIGSFVSYDDASPTLSFDTLNYFQADSAHLALTNINNTNSTIENELKLEFGLTIINVGEQADGDLNWISIGAEFLDYSRIWVGQVGFYIEPLVPEIVSNPVLIVNSTDPINKGESGVISLQMNIYEQSFTLSVTAKITAPGASPGFYICKFGLRTTGAGYCLENHTPTQSFVQDAVTGYNQEASFDFKEVIYSGEDGDAEASLIIMDLFVFLPDDESVVTGETYTVDFEVAINSVMTTVTGYFTSEGNVTPTEALIPPGFAISFPGITGVITYSPNELIQLQTVLSIPIGTFRDVKLRFRVSGQTVSIPILDIEIVDVGYNIGCMDTCSSFRPRIECPPVSNLASFSQPVVNRGLRCREEDNDISLNVYLRAEDIMVGGSETLEVELVVGALTQVTAQFDLTVSDRTSMLPVLPQIVSSIENDVHLTVGENVTHNVTIIFQPNTEFTYDFLVTSNADWMVVNSITLKHIGKVVVADFSNLLIVDSSTGGGYSATVALGYLNNIAMFENETTEEMRSILMEVNFGFQDGVSVNDAEVALMSFLVNASDGSPADMTDSIDLPFTVIAVNDSVDDITTNFKLNCPSDALSPGEVMSCWVTVNFTDRRDVLVFEADTSVNITGDRTLTIHTVNVASIGRNIRPAAAPTIEYRSSINNSQVDHVMVDFGYLINSDNSSDPLEDYVMIELVLQATDAEENENGAELVLGVGASVSDERVWVAYRSLVVERTGSEAVHLQYNTTVSDSGDILNYSLTLGHTLNVSSLEARPLTATLYLPPYLTYDTSYSDFDATTTVSGNKVIFTAPQLHFSDVFSVSVTLMRSCDYTLSFKENWKATIILEIQYQTFLRDAGGVVTPSGALSGVLKEPLHPVTTEFNVSRIAASAGKPPTCLSPVPLGMESGIIEDCQVTSSQASDPLDNPSEARRNGVSAWRVGKSGPLAGKRWMKIDIGRLSAVAMIQTQGGGVPSYEGDIGEYEVFYSTDDLIYRRGYHLNQTTVSSIFDHRRTYPDPVPANYYDLHTTHFLIHPVEARFVIIRILENDEDNRIYNALRVELYGCPMEPEQLDKCENRSASDSYKRLPEEYDRGFVVNTATDTLYVCNVEVNSNIDLVQGPKEDVFLLKKEKRAVRCFRTTDTYLWQSLNSNIRSVIGYSPTTSGVYAIAGFADPAYVVSLDEGLHWKEIPEDELLTVRSAPDYVPYQELPIESTSDFNHLSDAVYRSIGDWQAKFDGMYGLGDDGNPRKILDWNSCCKSDD